MIGERWIDGYTRETLTWDLFLRSQSPEDSEVDLRRLVGVLDTAFEEEEK